jgi:hypothetical protein
MWRMLFEYDGGVGKLESTPLEARKASRSSMPSNESISLSAGEGGSMLAKRSILAD